MDPTPPRPPGRPRRTETDEQIVRATLELIREQGPGAVTVAAVSSRSGVARTTIYRRHRDREELLSLALRPVTDRGKPPDDRTVEEKFGWLLARTEEVLDHGIGMGGVASVLTDADPEFGSALRRSLEAGLRPIREQIEADRDAGRLVAGVDADTLLDLVVGCYLAERLRRGTPPGGEWRAQAAGLLSLLTAPR